MRRQRPGHTLQPTALVNEGFIKLFQDVNPHFADRVHFLALMSRVMQQVRSTIRGPTARPSAEPMPVSPGTPTSRCQRTVVTNSSSCSTCTALETLARENASLAQVVEMHYFGGMTAEEVTGASARSVHVVCHDLRLARAWLRRELARS
jgi:RNA polymerase sigma-70 factor, ECF subfamily